MTTTLSFKPGLDLPLWRPNAPPLAIDAVGQSLAWDQRNDTSRTCLIFQLRATTLFEVYNANQDDWLPLPSPALGGVFGAGATCVFNPSQGPRGLIGAGSTTTTIVLSTALAAAVGANQLADVGDGSGFRIRIIGKSAGGSGKTNSRNIIGNTAGTTPTITVDVPLDFTPAVGDGYEIHSGKVYLIGAGALAAGIFKSYDLATNSFATLAQTGLPATIATDSNAVAMSEEHVSLDRMPGTGFVNGGSSYDPAGMGLNGVTPLAKNCILATASSATSITGSGMPADLQVNEYVNFQVRIVEDTTTPTSVGQRSLISAHTGGATGVFTVATWGVTPSATAKFVVENNDNWILLRSSASASVYTYSISGDAWSTATFVASSAVVGAGVIFEQCFGIVRDPSHNRRHSHLFCIRGAATTGIDMLDIAAATTGVWTNTYVYGNLGQTFTTGTTGAYDAVTTGGKYIHINVNGGQRMARFNMLAPMMEPGTFVRYPGGVGTVGQKMAVNYMIDGGTKLALVFQKVTSTSVILSCAIQS